MLNTTPRGGAEKVLPRFVEVNVDPRGEATKVRSGVPPDGGNGEVSTAAADPRRRRGNGSLNHDRG